MPVLNQVGEPLNR